MTDISVLALFGIEITELEICEQTDSGDGWIALTRFVQAVPPIYDREVPGPLGKGISGSRGDALELEGGDMQPCIEAAGLGRPDNSVSQGFNKLKKACYGLTNIEHLRKRIYLIFDKSDHRK